MTGPASRGASARPAGPLEWWGRGRTFLVEVRAEMRRVTWPTRKEVIATTVVVLVLRRHRDVSVGARRAVRAGRGWAFKFAGGGMTDV